MNGLQPFSRIIPFCIYLLWTLHLSGQTSSPGASANWLEKVRFKPVVGLQFWAVYTTGEEVYNEATGRYDPVDNRYDAMLRRSRLGFRMQPLEDVQISVIGSMDVVGRDLLSATQGASNNGSMPAFGLWNAILQWRVVPKREVLHLAAGYLTPQVGREHITCALRVTSMEKSWSQNYLRRHLTGTGPGRAAGIQAGGLFRREGSRLALTYDAGIFNPLFEALGGNSTGKNASALTTIKVTLHVGDPESSTYSLSHKINYFSKRRGLSLGFSRAHQGATDLFTHNAATSLDALFNWGSWNLDGEWSWLSREGDTPSKQARCQTGYFRVSYNVLLERDRIIEPVVMFMQFRGAMDQEAQAEAVAVKSFAGRDQAVDVGLNYYPLTDIRFTLHYTWQQGNAGEGGDGVIFNNYFFQRDAGPIHRGDWLGLGVVLTY
ncbi:MAG: hypothetical protein KDC57_19340 [Saprospiraceae bacterium]|nr:hypothetical protein [Saprospiraceae bacterium]